MIISRKVFFLLLFLLVLGPILGVKLYWLACSQKTKGLMHFMGKEYSGQIVHEYPVISFVVGKETIWFNGEDNLFLPRHEIVPVRYNKSNPSDARVDIFVSIWGDTLIIGGITLLIWLIVFIHPDIVLHRSTFRLLIRWPFIQLVKPSSRSVRR